MKNLQHGCDIPYLLSHRPAVDFTVCSGVLRVAGVKRPSTAMLDFLRGHDRKLIALKDVLRAADLSRLQWILGRLRATRGLGRTIFGPISGIFELQELDSQF